MPTGHPSDGGGREDPLDGGDRATNLLVVGAGAKATALAAKVHALNTLGAGPLTLTIVEANEIAASWLGRNGMTSGEEPLAIPPIKDIGFPYRSAATFGALGEALDRAMLPFTWQRYMIDKGEYARWVNAGSPAVQHRDYGRYLTWALTQASAGVRIVRGRVTKVELPELRERWQVLVADSAGQYRHECDSLVLTGPGVHRALPHDPAVSERIFHCDSRRGELARIPADGACDIAIVGGGESALSALAFLRDFRPQTRMTVYTPMLPLSRGESFLENRVFSDPDSVAWSALDLETRRDFVKHCDRGVFDPGTLQSIAYDDRCQFATGRVTHVGARADRNGDGGRVCVEYAAAEGPTTAVHDYLINCTGFDLLEQLRGLFSPALRARIERQTGPVWDRPADADVPIGRALELEGMRPRLYIPGLGALRQGPGFANLGCLGLLANRMLEPLVAGEGGRTERHRAGLPLTAAG
ncbi:MAG TPA: SidA/IucD/PvdA family monooxygenase [Solirubrobacteraceae bacterium]|jgi:mycobactin lysine-N-oxygenase|nr:SidA/IucD/PvdA family monooxygenase [Solirubrobacteraceae bacterium]